MLSDLCIRRPVMTILLMASFLVAGWFGFRELPVAAVPRVDSPTISVSASLSGASPETMASSVAAVLEKQFSTISGITAMSSTSTLGSTSVVLEFDLDRDIDGAALDVQSAIASAQRRLPDDMTSPPSFRKVNPADQPVLFLALSSDQALLSDVNAYAESTILPRLSTLPGVAQVQIFGAQKYAVRVIADLDRLAARGLTMSDIQAALAAANSNQPVGTLTAGGRTQILDATGPIRRAADYRPVVITWQNGAPVRIEDVADVRDGVENEKNAGWTNGKRSILMAVQRQPDANTIDVVDGVKAMLPEIRASLPTGVDLDVTNDRSQSIRASIEEVEFSLALSVLLVVVVIFFFLRSARATLIPAIALPISLIGTFAGMWLFDLSINNVSLLALILCVGFVVDDAIVMLENIMRHVENGEKPFEAALKGSREVGFTIISMTLSLVAVFIPVAFMGGVVGRMFAEFGYVIAIAILISGVVSLTLTPMLCARLLKPHDPARREPLVLHSFEKSFAAVSRLYARTLKATMAVPGLMLAATLGTFVATAILFVQIPKGFFPQEDTGLLRGQTRGPEDVSFAAMLERHKAVEEAIAGDPDILSLQSSVGGGGGFGAQNNGNFFIALKSKPGRKASAAEVIRRLDRKAAAVPGIQTSFRSLQSIPTGGMSSRSQYQFTLQAPDIVLLRETAQRVAERMKAIPGLSGIDADLDINARSAVVEIDRVAAARLGLTIDQIRGTLYSVYGARQASTIYAPEDTYAVILDVDPKFGAIAEMLRKVTMRGAGGKLVPLDSIAKVVEKPTALSLAHVGQLPAVTVSFNLEPGVSLGTAVSDINAAVDEMDLPAQVTTSFRGAAQQFQDTVGNMGLLLFAAILVVYIVLGILYESFVHPITILSGLPSAGIGALITLMLFGMDLSVIAMIGIIMLIGIVKKNAIMMVDFAVERRAAGVPAREAIIEAALLRFRPIMMTTLAAILGALPIAIGTGAGAELRQPLGIAVVGGLIFSQLLTLYITPVVYLFFESVATRFKAWRIKTWRGKPRGEERQPELDLQAPRPPHLAAAE